MFHKTKEPVILKEACSAEEQLKQMELFLLTVSGKKKEALQQDIRNLRYGIQGEKEILYELRNSHFPMYVLHDIRIEAGSESAQIDFYIVTPKINFIVECKNLYGNMEITKDGRFVRHIMADGKKIEEGMYSPVTQNEHHLELLKEVWREKQGVFRRLSFDKKYDAMHQSLVVLTNPKTLLWDDEAPDTIRNQVIRSDQLVRFIREYHELSSRSTASDRDMRSTAEEVLALHCEAERDYTAKYKMPESCKTTEVLQLQSATSKGITQEGSTLPNPERKKWDREGKPHTDTAPKKSISKKAPAATSIICPKCGSRMVERSGKYGKFLGCSKYPECTYTKNY